MNAAHRRLWALARRHWVALLGLVAVSGLVVAVNPQKVTEALAAADPRSLLLILPCVLLLYLLHGLAWWVALRGAGAQVNLPEAIRVAWISQTFVFLPGGDLWRVPIVRSDGRLQPGVLVGMAQAASVASTGIRSGERTATAHGGPCGGCAKTWPRWAARWRPASSAR